MIQPQRVLAATALALLALNLSAPASAESYGPGDQTLTLGPGAFTATIPHFDTFNLGGTDNYWTVPGGVQIVAPLNLPDGAEIFQMCMYGLVEDPVDGAYHAWITQSLLVPDGGQPSVIFLDGSFLSNDPAIGTYGKKCTAPGFSYVFHDTFDLTGDGVPDEVAHTVRAAISLGRFGGVRISWRRQVSPAPATATFNDVPTTDGAFQYIEALVASGVTAGCGGGNYCPNAPLTRRQMAVFLSKALGLHWAN